MAVQGTKALIEHRRRFLLQFSGLGLSSTLLPGVLWAKVQDRQAQKITKAMLRDAEQIAGVQFDDAERELILNRVNENLERYDALRAVALPNHVPSALRFSPILPGMTFERTRKPLRSSRVPYVRRPHDLEDLAFWPLTCLRRLLRLRQVTSSELTEMYLTRLKRYRGTLHCVVTLTEDLARQQARRADADLAARKDRGPLLGIPWGVKDILATKGDKTSWGSALYKDQTFDYDATVVERLERAGAVLVAKLSTGELAYDDVWSDGTQEYQTRNPWDPSEGSSGSSAGPASATAAGLVGFAIGTESGGSILHPASRCGATGLRPTFGRVSRRGVMTVAGSLDKVGCLCRTVEDCALVLDAIHGPDGQDLTVVDVPFNWDARRDVSRVRIGYLRAAFTEERPEAVREGKAFDEATLAKLRALGFQLQPIGLPDLPIKEIEVMNGLFGELSATWDHLIRNRLDRMMTRHAKAEFGSVCRAGRLVPAVEHIQATRVRTLLMEEMDRLMKQVNVYVAPVSDPAGPIANANLDLTNLTGHPALVLPNGFTRRGTPLGISFVGRLYGEAELLAVAKAYQDATEFHRQHPRLSR